MTCEWKLDEPDWNAWSTQCGNMFIITDGTPLENEMVFCCYCGEGLREVDSDLKADLTQ
jgi:hypothetical protein